MKLEFEHTNSLVVFMQIIKIIQKQEIKNIYNKYTITKKHKTTHTKQETAALVN